MFRELSTLRRWASALEHDAAASLGGTWSLAVDDAYVLTVGHDDRQEQVLLSELVAEDSWPPQAWLPARREATLEDDATEALAGELLEVLRLWDVSWTSCSEHGSPVFVCSSAWICPGPSTHEIALVGGLPPPGEY